MLIRNIGLKPLWTFHELSWKIFSLLVLFEQCRLTYSITLLLSMKKPNHLCITVTNVYFLIADVSLLLCHWCSLKTIMIWERFLGKGIGRFQKLIIKIKSYVQWSLRVQKESYWEISSDHEGLKSLPWK